MAPSAWIVVSLDPTVAKLVVNGPLRDEMLAVAVALVPWVKLENCVRFVRH